MATVMVRPVARELGWLVVVERPQPAI
jgi:hypothetical protein